jgi:hypothetical protein
VLAKFIVLAVDAGHIAVRKENGPGTGFSGNRRFFSVMGHKTAYFGAKAGSAIA